MSQNNPYAVSELYSQPECVRDEFDLLDPAQFRVEVPFIVCGKKVQLPRVCILTGETDDLVPAHKAIQLPSWKFDLFGKQCDATFFMSGTRRRQMRYAYFSGLLMSLAGGISTVISPWYQQWLPITLPAGIVLFLIGAWLHSRGSVPLVIRRSERGKKFWLAGFSPQFFESLLRLRGTS